MDATTTGALIALIGVIVSTLISGFLSHWVAARQSSHRFNELLYQARISAYPTAYEIVSRLAKDARYDRLTQDGLSEALAALDEWDSKHALLMSPMATRAIFDLRFHLVSLTSKALVIEDVKKPLIRSISELENAMKTELGVYAMGDFHNPQVIKDVSEYIPKALRESHNKSNQSRGQ